MLTEPRASKRSGRVPSGGTRKGRQPSRRDDILQAAVQLFAKGGSRGTCIAAIAERIGVTPPAVIHHFGTKDALMLEVVAEIDRLRPDLFARPDEMSGSESLRLLGRWGRWLEQDDSLANLARLATVMVGEALDPDHRGHDYFVQRAEEFRLNLASLVTAGQSDGSIRRDVNPTRVATQIVGLLQGIQIQWFLEPGKVPIAAVLEEFFTVYLDGLAAAP